MDQHRLDSGNMEISRDIRRFMKKYKNIEIVERIKQNTCFIGIVEEFNVNV